MKEPGITLLFRGRVSRDIRAELRRLAEAIPAVSPPRHRIQVNVVPNPCVGGPEDGYGFGACLTPGAAGATVKGFDVGIYVAAGLAEICQQHGDSRAEAVGMVAHTFLHEYAHYEQFRDGRPVQERGVNVRARTLARRLSGVSG